MPSTVLSALIKHDVYPDFRFGLNSFLIPELFLDNKIIDAKLVWDRKDQNKKIEFNCRINKSGLHEIKIGDKFVIVKAHTEND